MQNSLVIIPTVDVEGVHGSRPFEQLVLGEVGASESWGVNRIASIFSEYGVSVTFFVDVYEYTLWGMEPWRQVCLQLFQRGQDVQLHTHPGWRDDVRDSTWLRELKRDRSFLDQDKDLMSKLSLEEQTNVLRFGSDLIHTWLGVRPIAHRSGGYSVNYNTLAALRKTGFKVDSSQNQAHINSKLKGTVNVPFIENDVLEIPLTLYDRCLSPSGPLLRWIFRRLKTSVRFSTNTELIGFCRVALQAGLPIMNLFMHSYSLLRFDKRFQKIEPYPQIEQRLRQFLEWVMNQPDVHVMSISQYYNSALWKNRLAPSTTDVVPRLAGGRQLVSDLVERVLYNIG